MGIVCFTLRYEHYYPSVSVTKVHGMQDRQDLCGADEPLDRLIVRYVAGSMGGFVPTQRGVVFVRGRRACHQQSPPRSMAGLCFAISNRLMLGGGQVIHKILE